MVSSLRFLYTNAEYATKLIITDSVRAKAKNVYFDNKLVGWLYTYCKNFLCPIEETFWSINLTKEQADKLNIKYIESEDNGFYQATLHLRQSQQYTDLYVILTFKSLVISL